MNTNFLLRTILFVSAFLFFGMLLPLAWYVRYGVNPIAGTKSIPAWLGCLVLMVVTAIVMNLRAGGTDRSTFKIVLAAWVVVILGVLVIRFL